MTALPVAARNRAWPTTLFLLIATIGWVLFWYWDTARAMVAIWARSDTYAHAFIVPPITLWLIWRKRHELARLNPEPTLWMVLPILATTIFWLMGELTAVNALTQFALVTTLVLAVISTLGIAVSRQIAFPLAFLLLCIPIGDFMLPKLMEWTASFTVLALRASGIPVYQEGLQFVIPSGSWSVVEACSGIRYIIASVTVGTLFAYLNYVTLRRRLIFIAISLIVPVIANWLRAYMIVMIGHLSSNKLAVGVDHLIYGWIFFGVVIMAMFAIGARWSEQAPAETHSIIVQQPAVSRKGFSSWRVMAAIALLTAGGPIAYLAIANADKAAPATLGSLNTPPGWSPAPAFTAWTPAYENPSASLQATFDDGNGPVGVYVAYYRSQDYERKLITSTNALVTSNDRIWSVISRGALKAALPDSPLGVTITEILSKEGGIESRFTVWQWYWINGRLTTSDIEAKWLTALSRISGRGDDSAVVMLYAPAGRSPERLSAFAAAAGPQIQQLLAATREAR
jgi:exosortase A